MRALHNPIFCSKCIHDSNATGRYTLHGCVRMPHMQLSCLPALPALTILDADHATIIYILSVPRPRRKETNQDNGTGTLMLVYRLNGRGCCPL